MKLGKIRGNAYDRCIAKEFIRCRQDIEYSPGADAAILTATIEDTIMATETVAYDYDRSEELALHRACNNLYAMGGEVRAVQMSIVLPLSYEEACFREKMRRVHGFCKEHHLQLAGGHTEAAGAVNAPIITAVAVGAVKKEDKLSLKQVRAGHELVVAGTIAKEGVLVALAKKDKELKERFTGTFLSQALERAQDLSIGPIAAIAKSQGALAIHDLASGGIFGGLWEMAQASLVGLDLNLKEVPIDQHSVEICEFLGLNPYELASSGSALIATEDGQELVERMQQAGIPAALLGQITSSHDRIFHNGEEIRYLDLPKADELYKLETDNL